MSTIKDIQIRSKGGAAKFTSDRPWAAIQVVTKEGDWPVLQEENLMGVLQLHFWDTAWQLGVDFGSTSDNYVLFDDEKAGQIIDFVTDVWDKIDVLLVHCEMGMSRSPAIGAAIAYCWHGPGCEKDLFNKHTPNMFVYSKLLKAICKRSGATPPTDLPKFEGKILEDPWNPMDDSDGGSEVPMKKLSEVGGKQHFYYEHGKPPAIFCHEFVKLAKRVGCLAEDGHTHLKFNCWNCSLEDLCWVPEEADVQQV